MSTIPAHYTGRLARICSYCRTKYGETPCVPEMDGKESHGICATCLPGVQAEIDALFFAGAHREKPACGSRTPEDTPMEKVRPETFVVSVSETGRRYLDARDLAALCEVTVYAIDTRFRPEAWAMPRDFRWTTATMLIAEDRMGQLADAFEAHGAHDAAGILREFMVAHLARVAAERAATVEAMPRPAEPVAADTPTQPESRLLKWERDHDL